MTNIINGTPEDDVLQGTDEVDIINGLEGNDRISSLGDGDILNGGAGNDTLTTYELSRGTTFYGGKGNDKLSGGVYGDTYLFNLGDGQDAIYDMGGGEDPGYNRGAPAPDGTDILRFGDGIRSQDISTRREGGALIISHSNGTDQLTLKWWFSSIPYNRLEAMEFADGTVLDFAVINQQSFTINGTEGNDTIDATDVHHGSNLIINGGSGNDQLSTSGDRSTLNGGAGNDILKATYSAEDIILHGGTGNDQLHGSTHANTYLFNLGDEQDTIYDSHWGPDNIDTLKFGADIRSQDISSRRVGADLILSHSNGTDQVTVKDWYRNGTQYQLEVIEFAGGSTLDLSVINQQSFTVNGTAGDDTIDTDDYGDNVIVNAGDGNDKLYASTINSTLHGGTGNDQLYGSYYYADTYLFNLGDGQDTIYEQPEDSVGVDTLKFGADIRSQDISSRRVGADLILSHSNGTDQVIVKNWYKDTDQQLEVIEFTDGTVLDLSVINQQSFIINGTAGDDIINADVREYGHNVIVNAGSGNDQLSILGHNSILNGEAGNDILKIDLYSKGAILHGGTGNDQLYGNEYGNTYLFNLGDEQDTIYEDSWYSDEIDTLQFGFGIRSQDISSSRARADLILSHSNATDQVTVKDWYKGTDQQLEVIEFTDGTVLDLSAINQQSFIINGTAGDDTINASADEYGHNIIINGGSGNDQLSTSGDSSILNGGAGDDILSAYRGNDLLNGGAGSDYMTGGNGQDVYIVDNRDDRIFESSYGDGGWDTVYSSVNYTLPDNVERVYLAGNARQATGNEQSNYLYGNQENNLLNGQAGSDYMAGANGHDIYIVDHINDNVVETVSGGWDTIYSSANYTLTKNVERIYLTGDARQATGNKLNNYLYGNQENNVLNGQAGSDYMAGANGHDIYIVDNINDNVVETLNSGWDTVYSSVDYTLHDNIEHAYLTGDARQATGNKLNNYLYGNQENNILNGQAGSDYMAGDNGQDIYIVDNINDNVVETVNGGWDTVYSSINYTLHDNVERAYLTSDARQATGNELNNYLYGNQENNLLNGQAGSDYMAGANGHDVYIVDNINDNIVEMLNSGWDTIYSSVDFSLAANIERLILLGSDNINATGNNANNHLTGNAGNNQLKGRGGNDTLTGGAGSDTYLFELGDGQDVLKNFDTGATSYDVLNFGNNITSEQLAFSQVANDLMISISGSDNSVSIEGWFVAEDYQLDAIILGATGIVITNDNIADLYGF